MDKVSDDGMDPEQNVQFDFGYSDSESENDSGAEDSANPVKFFTHELSLRGRLRRYFVRNPRTRLASTYVELILTIGICLAYVVRVSMDEPYKYACQGVRCNNVTMPELPEDDSMVFTSTHINWYILTWVQRPLWLWVIQVILAFLVLFKFVFFILVIPKGHQREQIFSIRCALIIVSVVPMLVTVFYPPGLQHLFVPSFLCCWLSKQALERIRNDLHQARQRFQTISNTLTHHIALLAVTLFCVIFITVCGIQHIQRGSWHKPLTIFEAVYFVIVTFSTVGYGDISPDIYLGQVFIMLMIIIAFALFPHQIQVIALTWLERQKTGGVYSKRNAAQNKHVIVCATSLTLDAVMDFLNEFYAHRKLERHNVILLSPQELDSNIQIILKDPKWMHRVIYIRGSALKDIDLERCRLREAEACFLLPPRLTSNKEKADQHTVLRSWAVKDYAPHCKQYIHLFKAKNKMHIKFAEHLVCEDEFKYALLANNCLYPGLSTLVALLVHTSTGLEGDIAPNYWQQVYGHHSGNEIYHIQLGKSVFFKQYEGWSFPEASADAHQRFGVSLLAVLAGDGGMSRRLQLNPGKDYHLKKEDFCFYMSVTREEYAKISPAAIARTPNRIVKMEALAETLQKYGNVANDTGTDLEASAYDTVTNLEGDRHHHPPLTIFEQIHGAHHHFQKRRRSSSSNNNTEDADMELMPMLSHAGKAEEAGANYMDTKLDTVEEEEGGGGIKASERSYDEVDHRHNRGKLLQQFPEMRDLMKTGHPPVTIYTGTNRAVCHIMREPRPHCCLQWNQTCEHCNYRHANDHRWDRHLIIMAAQKPTSGLHNFIVPLRSSFISVNGLSAIILLLETTPEPIFLDFIAMFPLVFWMKGSITSLDDLLRAGINKASHLVVVNREPRDKDSLSKTNAEETLVDSETIITVQTIFRLFPNANIITELSQASNMRFMQFSAQDVYCHKISRLEQKLKATMNSNLSHIFRLPFAAGQVFSASMLDTLLYQTFVKGYLITFVRLLLGIDAEEGSGHLSSIRVTKGMTKQYPTFGHMYKMLCHSSGEIPFALYHTELNCGDKNVEADEKKKGKKKIKRTLTASNSSGPTSPFQAFRKMEVMDVKGLVQNRMKTLSMADDYSEVKKVPNAISYVIANPSPKRKLKMGDIIYVIQPSSMTAKPNRPKLPLHRSNSFSGLNSAMLSASPFPTSNCATYSGSPLRLTQQIPDFAEGQEKKAGLEPLTEESGQGPVQIGRFNLKRYRKNSCPASSADSNKV
ncbi:potassium channel subfamily T member 2-like [Babylonia areolata]|uniref:potassium channel subfamily T member 2-like n=1 Tax=Babylonia areolata TaxID=304850 RepID=UPI003FD56875